MARLRVRTVCGDFDLEGVAAPAEVLAAASAALPELAAPDGRIVYAGRPLGDVSELSSAGVSDGSTLVVLRRRPRPPETSGDTDLRRGPDQETIARVTAAHAKSREGQQQVIQANPGTPRSSCRYSRPSAPLSHPPFPHLPSSRLFPPPCPFALPVPVPFLLPPCPPSPILSLFLPRFTCKRPIQISGYVKFGFEHRSVSAKPSPCRPI